MLTVTKISSNLPAPYPRLNSQHKNMSAFANQQTYDLFAPEALANSYPLFKRNHGGMDVVSDLAVPLPGIIITEIFGVPETDRANMLEWARDIGTFFGAAGGSTIEMAELARKADKAAVKFCALIRQLIKQRRRQPGTDMISLLSVAYQEQGFNDRELPFLCMEILNTGLLTTTDQIANGVNALLCHPDQLQKLKTNPTLINSAVEEILRFDTSVPFLTRIAKQDLTIGGKDITAGSVIALGFGGES